MKSQVPVQAWIDLIYNQLFYKHFAIPFYNWGKLMMQNANKYHFQNFEQNPWADSLQ